MKRLGLLLIAVLAACESGSPSKSRKTNTLQNAFPPKLTLTANWTLTDSDMAATPNKVVGSFVGELTRKSADKMSANYDGSALKSVEVVITDDLSGQGTARCTTTIKQSSLTTQRLLLLDNGGKQFSAGVSVFGNAQKECNDNGTITTEMITTTAGTSLPTDACGTPARVTLPVDGAFDGFTSTQEVSCGTKRVTITFQVAAP